jgi:hypothetical protein
VQVGSVPANESVPAGRLFARSPLAAASRACCARLVEPLEQPDPLACRQLDPSSAD